MRTFAYCLAALALSAVSCARTGNISAVTTESDCIQVTTNHAFVADSNGNRNQYDGDTGSLSVRQTGGVPELRVEVFKK
jgi:hypothetical protein